MNKHFAPRLLQQRLFWSYHEVEPDVYDWTSEHGNMTHFIELYY
jgi:hypothetical protein